MKKILVRCRFSQNVAEESQLALAESTRLYLELFQSRMDCIEALRIRLLRIHAVLQFRFNSFLIYGLAQLKNNLSYVISSVGVTPEIRQNYSGGRKVFDAIHAWWPLRAHTPNLLWACEGEGDA